MTKENTMYTTDVQKMVETAGTKVAY